MNTQPFFTASVLAGVVLVSTANTNTDGTSGSRADVTLVAGANGTRLDSVQVKGIVAVGSTQAADMVRLWLHNGTNAFFFKEITVAVGSGVVSVTVPNFETTVALGFDLPSGWKLQASTNAGGATASYHVTAFGGSY